ncbi:hypothetical protein JMM51_04655 [Rhodovulum sulfidophilum]|nr:hypothetical protein [Rhodovulum sulfidophilum]
MGVDDGLNAAFLSRRELVVDETHRPDRVRSMSLPGIFTRFRLHPPLRVPAAQLKAQPVVNPSDLPHVHHPPLTPPQHMDAPVAMLHALLCNLPDPPFNRSLTGAPGRVVERRGVEPQGPTSPRSTRSNRCTSRDPTRASEQASELSANDVLQHLAVEGKVVDDLLQSRGLGLQRISAGSRPPCFFFQLKQVA